MGKITTHVLDTASGKPAMDVRISLINSATGDILVEAQTNDDGRCDKPLLEGDHLSTGRYRIEFHIGNYFTQQNMSQDDVPFLDMVPVEFGITDADAHYHIPLLISPYGYSTYRGS